MLSVQQLLAMVNEDLLAIEGEPESARIYCAVVRVQREVLRDAIAIVRQEYQRWKDAETDDVGIEIGAIGAVANIYARLEGFEPCARDEPSSV